VLNVVEILLQPSGNYTPPIDQATAEKLVIDAARDFFDNADTGNRYAGLMKTAYDW
jgi:hypothetical protein